MKLGPVTKLDKRNKTSKKYDNDVMSANYDLIVILWPIWSNPEAASRTHSL